MPATTAMTPTVAKILSHYESDNPGTKANLARILMAGRLGGTGKMVILPVDQGFEHGPARSFAVNAPGYDPHYHFQLAIDAGLNAYAAPLGMIEAVADHVCETLFVQDARVQAVTVKIVKLAIASAGEKIGITLHRERRA